MPLVALAYLGAHGLSLLGNGLAAVALPLIVLQVTGDPAGVGVVALAAAGPAVVVGLGAGLVLDRVNRRTCSIVSDGISAAAVAAVPLVAVLWGLDLGWLVALAIVGAFGDVPGLTAREVLVPALARHTGMPLERLIGLRQTVTSLALVLGPAAAGALFAVFEGTTVLLVTAACSAAAALGTLVLPHRVGRVPEGPARASVLSELAAGAAVLRRNRLLTGTVGLTLGLAVAVGGLQGLVLPVYFDAAGRPDLLGLVLAALAVGMLAGAALFSALGARGPRAVWVVLGLLGASAGLATMATLASPLTILVGAGVLGVSNAVLGAVLGVVQAERVPEATRGRVLGLQNALLQVAAPGGIGAAAGVAALGSPWAAGPVLVGAWVAVVLAVACSGAPRELRTPADAQVQAAGPEPRATSTGS